MRQVYKLIILFIIMGVSYYIIEIIFDGLSHWSMIICAGIAGTFGGLINEYIKIELWKQSLIITVVILMLEFATGYIVNILFDLNVWDYSKYSFNLYGQICLHYGIIWFIFSPFIIWYDDFLRWKLFKEEKVGSILNIYRDFFVLK